MTIEELRNQIIDRIKAKPETFRQLAREIGIKSSKVLASFIRAQSIPNFKNLVLLQNWVEKPLYEEIEEQDYV